VNNSQVDIIEAYNAVREGNFQEAVTLSNKVIETDKKNFWGWFLAAVAYGFLDDRPNFINYLNAAKKLKSNSTISYINYLSAYAALWEKDIEKALWYWTQISDYSEGWLASELIEKARKEIPLIQMAHDAEFSNFIILPDFLSQIKEKANTENSEKVLNNQEQVYKKIIISNSRKILIFIIVIIFIFTFIYVISFSKNETEIAEADKIEKYPWKKLSIDSEAAVTNSSDKSKVLYFYNDRGTLVSDFEKAKNHLIDKKVNLTRYLLQRIINSNADFKSKEKAKIFLNFIPDLDYEEFNDLIFVSEILKEPEFFYNCLVLLEGKLVRLKDVEKGKEVRLLVKEKEKEYLVEGFLPTNDNKPTWLSYEEFNQKRNDFSSKQKKAIVYGKYKGLIGKQKIIYLEIITFWN